jgi:hypothetical protein
MNVDFVNLTPHEVVLELAGGARHVLPPSGSVARLGTEVREAGALAGVPLVAIRHGAVADLPGPQPDRVYVVALLVAAACPERDDVVAPDTSPDSVVRDERGRIVAVRRLATFHDDRVGE